MAPQYEIVILSYNHPQLTTQTIQSVLNLSFPANKIHLIHNGSLPQHTETLRTTFPQINHLIMPQNKGFSGGANFGLLEVFKKTENILFLTNDIEVFELPLKFPENLDFFSIYILKRNTSHVDSVIGAIDLKKGHLSHIKDLTHLKPKQTTYIPGTAFGITKQAFDRLQSFDESLHTYWEDVELSLRAHQMGLRLGSCDWFKIKHKIGKTCHKDRFYTLFLFQRNRKRILKKYGTGLFRFYCLYAYDMVKIVSHLLRGPNKKANLQLWWKAVYDSDISVDKKI